MTFSAVLALETRVKASRPLGLVKVVAFFVFVEVTFRLLITAGMVKIYDWSKGFSLLVNRKEVVGGSLQKSSNFMRGGWTRLPSPLYALSRVEWLGLYNHEKYLGSLQWQGYLELIYFVE